MWYLKEIQAKDLFSWSKLFLKLEDQHVYSIVGHNGAGKSSIFETIKWVLFKKSNKKTVPRYGTKNGEGTLVFSDQNGASLSVCRRVSSPATIFINGTEATQEHLEDIIGCTYSSFMTAVMCDQKRVSSFINEKSPSGRSKIFGEMVGASILDRIREIVQKKKQENEREYDSAKATLDTLETQLDELEADFGSDTPQEFLEELKKRALKLKKYQAEAKKWQEKLSQANAIEEKWINYERSEKVIATLKAKIQELTASIQALKSRLDSSEYIKREKAFQRLREAESKAEEAMQKSDIERGPLVTQAKELQSALKDDGKCPTCGTKLRTIDKKPIQKKLNSIKTQIDELGNMGKEAYEKMREIRGKKDKLAKWISSYEADLGLMQQLKDTLAEKKVTLGFLGFGGKPTEERMDPVAIQEEVNKWGRTTWNVNNEIRDGKAKLAQYKALKQKVKKAKESYEVVSGRYQIFQWMFDNLPIMKLRFIDENKTVVESLANEQLSKMGLPFVIKIDTQREMSKGKRIKDEFTFKIINAHSDKEAHRDDLSGGEEVCILIAMQIAINHVFNTNFGFEVYDEIYAPLDKKNKAVVTEALKVRGQEKQILSVSHDDEISHSFDAVIEIGNKDGISFVKGEQDVN